MAVTGGGMRAKSAVLAAVSAGLLAFIAVASTPATAQQAEAAPNPGGAQSADPNWAGTVTQTPESGPTQFTPEQTAAVQQVSQYFNQLTNLKGSFLQTDPDKKQMRGKFFVKKPGRFRFDYGAPSLKVIVSDGTWLAIQDHDLNTEDVYELDNTPFRLLLRDDVDLLRDARILDVQEAEDLVIVTLQDKSPDAPGQITLFLSKAPQLQLKEWVTVDAQGLQTRVQLSNVDTTENLDPALFKRENLTLKKFQR